MNSIKRIVIATVLGLSSAILVLGGMYLGAEAEMPPEILLRMLVSNGFMGFAIGISSLRCHWALNGLLIGAIVGLIEGLASAIVGYDLVIPLVGNTIFGLLIELITTVGFKAGVSSRVAT